MADDTLKTDVALAEVVTAVVNLGAAVRRLKDISHPEPDAEFDRRIGAALRALNETSETLQRILVAERRRP